MTNAITDSLDPPVEAATIDTLAAYFKVNLICPPFSFPSSKLVIAFVPASASSLTLAVTVPKI